MVSARCSAALSGHSDGNVRMLARMWDGQSVSLYASSCSCACSCCFLSSASSHGACAPLSPAGRSFCDGFCVADSHRQTSYSSSHVIYSPWGCVECCIDCWPIVCQDLVSAACGLLHRFILFSAVQFTCCLAVTTCCLVGTSVARGLVLHL